MFVLAGVARGLRFEAVGIGWAGCWMLEAWRFLHTIRHVRVVFYRMAHHTFFIHVNSVDFRVSILINFCTV